VVNITEPSENKPSIRDMMNKVSEEASEPSEQDEEKKEEAPKESLQKKEVHTEKAVKEDPSKKALPFVEEANNELEKQMKVRKEVQKDFYGIPYEPVVSVDTWHFLVSGTEEIFTLDCAKEIMRQVALENPNCPTKMLKISAQKIGNANIINSLDKFLGNMVIVEKAGSLSEKQLTDFSKVLDKDDRSLLVAFIDSKKELQKMLLTVPSLQHSFTAVFEGKCFEPEDLVQLAKEWLYNEDARMSQDAENACYDYASALLEVHYGSYRSEIIAYAERALRYGEKGGFLRLSAGKVDDDGFLILTEKHFRKAEKK